MLKVHIDAIISSKYIPKLAIKLFPINQVKIPSDYIKCISLVVE